MNTTMNHSEKGFTLIETMIAVAIIGFLAITGWRQYDEYRNRVVRADAINALTRAANEMENCAVRRGNVYTNCAPAANLSPNGHYNIVTVTTPTTFQVTAVRRVFNAEDRQCLLGNQNYDLLINELGQQGISLGQGVPIFNTFRVDRCWNR